jgi:hypothetical protein
MIAQLPILLLLLLQEVGKLLHQKSIFFHPTILLLKLAAAVVDLLAAIVGVGQVKVYFWPLDNNAGADLNGVWHKGGSCYLSWPGPRRWP